MSQAQTPAKTSLLENPLYNAPVEVRQSYLSIKDINTIMGWPKSRGQDLMRQFYEQRKAIKEGRGFRLHVAYFNEWRDQRDGSLTRFSQPLQVLKGGQT
jgi:hypothetical protein